MPEGKKSKEAKESKEKATIEELHSIISEKKYYTDASMKQREEWERLWKLYVGTLPATQHKSLSQNFIPKTHQAVELMASFLAGNEPSIIALPVGEDDDDKAAFLGRLLEFQWLHVMRMKPKVLTWVKSAILFGVGIMKVGWDSEKDEPFAYPLNIGNFYCDPYSRHIQDMESVIERMVLPVKYVEKRYNVTGLVPIATSSNSTDDSSQFDHEDMQQDEVSEAQRVEVLERWTKDEVLTVAVQQKEKDGKKNEVGLVLEKKKNPYGFIPYVSLHYKDSPLPNRFYTIGAIEPVRRVHNRINQLINQGIDNVNLVMSPSARIRRGSGIDPRELQRFPGRAIFMNNIESDMIWDEVPDVTATMFKMLQFLDNEFQQGTSVTDIRLGERSSGTAAEAKIQQGNLNVQTSLVKENVEYAIAEVGQMIAKLDIKNIDSVRSIRIFDPDEVFEYQKLSGKRQLGKDGFPMEISADERQDIKRNGRVFKFDKGDLDGEFDIRVKADSTMLQNRDVLRKQLIDFAQFMASLGVKLDTNRIADKWGELSGIPNAHKLLLSEPTLDIGPSVGPGGGQSLAPAGTTPTGTSEGVTGRGIEAAVQDGTNPLTV